MPATRITLHAALLAACACWVPAQDAPSGSLMAVGGIKLLDDFEDDLQVQGGGGVLVEQSVSGPWRFAFGALFNGRRTNEDAFEAETQMLEFQIGVKYAIVGERLGFSAGAGPELAWTRYTLDGGGPVEAASTAFGWGLWTQVGGYVRLGDTWTLGAVTGYTFTEEYIGEGDDQATSSGAWVAATFGVVW